MPLRFVLDTNVVLDLLHFADPAALPILAALADGRAECWCDEAMLDELRRVVGYPELKISDGAALVARYQQLVRLAPATPVAPPLPRCRDTDDQKFLELSSRLPAAWLISKDKALLTLARTRGLGFRILTPVAATAELRTYQQTTVRP